MIGDYTRTAISTIFNTGTYVGVGANIFNGTVVAGKLIKFDKGKMGIFSGRSLIFFITNCSKIYKNFYITNI